MSSDSNGEDMRGNSMDDTDFAFERKRKGKQRRDRAPAKVDPKRLEKGRSTRRGRSYDLGLEDDDPIDGFEEDIGQG